MIRKDNEMGSCHAWAAATLGQLSRLGSCHALATEKKNMQRAIRKKRKNDAYLR